MSPTTSPSDSTQIVVRSRPLHHARLCFFIALVQDPEVYGTCAEPAPFTRCHAASRPDASHVAAPATGDDWLRDDHHRRSRFTAGLLDERAGLEWETMLEHFLPLQCAHKLCLAKLCKCHEPHCGTQSILESDQRLADGNHPGGNGHLIVPGSRTHGTLFVCRGISHAGIVGLMLAMNSCMKCVQAGHFRLQNGSQTGARGHEAC